MCLRLSTSCSATTVGCRSVVFSVFLSSILSLKIHHEHKGSATIKAHEATVQLPEVTQTEREGRGPCNTEQEAATDLEM